MMIIVQIKKKKIFFLHLHNEKRFLLQLLDEMIIKISYTLQFLMIQFFFKINR